jgi:hypothetical protein
MAEEKQDFGENILKQQGENAKHVFSNFGIFNLAWVDDKLFTTSSDVEFQGKIYTASIDFSGDMYKELLRILPFDIVKQIRNKFKGSFVHPVSISWRLKTEICIEAKLGVPVENDGEVFVPFVAEKVYKNKDGK